MSIVRLIRFVRLQHDFEMQNGGMRITFLPQYRASIALSQIKVLKKLSD